MPLQISTPHLPHRGSPSDLTDSTRLVLFILSTGILSAGSALMQPLDLRKALAAHFPRWWVHEFIRVSEGKHRSKRHKLNFRREPTSHAWEERKEKWNFTTAFLY